MAQSHYKALVLAILVSALSALLWHRISGSTIVAQPLSEQNGEVSASQESAQRRRVDVLERAASGLQAVAASPLGLPSSLQGSVPDGEVTLDADGRVAPTLGLRRLFDYFLSSIGELDASAIRMRLLAHVRTLYGQRVARDVSEWFDRYIDYQQALAAAERNLPGALPDRLAFAKQLRRRFFNAAAAEAFFGEEEAYADYTLERMRISRDSTFDAPLRAEQLEALEHTLSPEQRTSLQIASTALIAEEQSRQFDALQLDDAKRHEERSALFGAAAATRLADLDRDRAVWEQRLQAYVQARYRLRNERGYGEAERAQRIAQWRASRFDSAEIRRIQSLEAIGAL